jgi:alkylation response protein AidB-like acyl-CoA dehydrogenase
MDFQLLEHQQDLVKATRALAVGEFASKAYTWEAQGRFPREYLKVLAAHGLAGITIPEADGGQGGSLMDSVLVLETIAGICPSAGDCVQALNFGAIQQLAQHGSPTLKSRYLAPCLRGDAMVSISMTEPDAGSAVTDLRTRAVVRDGEVVVNGRKIFTSNAEHVDHFVVWVKFGEGPRDAGAVVMDRDTPGLTIDTTHRFMSGEPYGMLYLDDAKVPAENILVPTDGFQRLLSVFNVERLGNATRSLALGQAALDLAIAHVKSRHQFGRALMEFQGLQWRIAEMKLKIEAARLLLYRAATNADRGLPSPLEAALAKVACNRAGFEVANDALQLFGGHGYDNDAPVNYIFRRTRGWMIAGGTTEQMLNRIASETLDQRFSQRSRDGRHS